MRKIISVILAALMLFSVMAVSAFAADVCTCDDHKTTGACHCCIDCPDITWGYVTPCAKDYIDGEYKLTGEFCCSDCSGVVNNNLECGCSCPCCSINSDGTIGDSKTPIGGNWDQIWDEEAQENFVSGFQAVLKRISDVFDKIFDAIFDFLRLDTILPGARD